MSDQDQSAEAAKPLFVDNRNGNTLARAITAHLEALRQDDHTPAELCVASCYFNPQGLELIGQRYGFLAVVDHIHTQVLLQILADAGQILEQGDAHLRQ